MASKEPKSWQYGPRSKNTPVPRGLASREADLRRWRVARRRLFAFLGLLLVIVAFVFFIVWTDRGVPLLAICAGPYEFAPPNALAWEDIDRLAQAFPRDNVDVRFLAPWQDGAAAANRKPLASRAIVNSREEFIDALIGQIENDQVRAPGRAKPLLFYISAHGVVNGMGEPCLLLEGDDPRQEENWLPVAELIRQLQKSTGADVTKVILLDAGRVQNDWRLGILDNGFAAALAQLVTPSRLEGHAIYFLNSTRGHQQSFAAPVELGGTPFGYFVARGLREAAGLRGNRHRVSLLELEQYVRDNVSRWVRQHRGGLQEPILIPSLEPTQDIDLIRVARAPRAIEPRGLDLRPELRKLSVYWRDFAELERQRPYQQWPAEWATLQAQLQRATQLVLAGQAYHNQFSQQLSPAWKDCQESLRRPLLRGDLPPTASLARREAQWAESWDSPGLSHDLGGIQTVWQQWQSQPDDATATQTWQDTVARHDRYQVVLAVWRRLVDVDLPAAKDLLQLRQRIQALVQQADQLLEGDRPVEIELLQLLHSGADWGTTAADTLRQASQLLIAQRWRSERLAAATTVNEQSGVLRREPRGLPWVSSPLAAADATWREALDRLLIGTPEELETAIELLRTHDQLLGELEHLAGDLQRAYELRDDANCKVPFLWQYVLGEHRHDLQDPLQRLAVATPKLSQLLVEGPPKGSLTEVAAQLEDAVQAVSDPLEQVFGDLAKWVAHSMEKERSASGDQLDRVRRRFLLPLTMGADINDSEVLDRLAQSPDTGQHAPVAGTGGGETVPQRSGELASETGELPAGEQRVPQPHPLRDLLDLQEATPQAASTTLARLGQIVRQRLSGVGEDGLYRSAASQLSQAIESLGHSAADPLQAVRQAGRVDARLRAAAAVTEMWRHAGGPRPPASQHFFVLSHHELIYQQAERCFQDAWATPASGRGSRRAVGRTRLPPSRREDEVPAEPSGGDYYFSVAVRQQLGVTDGPPDSNALTAAGRIVGLLGLEPYADLRERLDVRSLTYLRRLDEQRAQRQQQFSAWTPCRVAPVFGQDSAHAIQIDDPAPVDTGQFSIYVARQRPLTAAGNDDEPLVVVTDPIDGHEIRRRVAQSGAPLRHQLPSAAHAGGELEAVAYFRGHRVAVPLNAVGTEISLARPRQASVQLRGQRIEGRHRVVFLLDCSSSMVTQGNKQRFTRAKEALLRVIPALESDQLQVALMAFSHRSGIKLAGEREYARERDDIHPLADVELLQAPQRMTPAVRDAWNRSLRSLNARGLTPLYYAIHRALRVARDDSGFAPHVIVITDGVPTDVDPAARSKEWYPLDDVGQLLAEDNGLARELQFDSRAAETASALARLRKLIDDARGVVTQIDMVGIGDLNSNIMTAITQGYGRYEPVRGDFSTSELEQVLRALLGLTQFRIVGPSMEGRGRAWEICEQAVLDIVPGRHRIEILGPQGEPHRAGAQRLQLDGILFEGGESLQARLFDYGVRDRLPGRLEYVPFRDLPEGGAIRGGGQDMQRDGWQLLPMTTIFSDGRPQFRLAVERTDRTQFSARPALLWAEVYPIVDGREAATPFYAYDRTFQPGTSVPVCLFSVPSWDAGAARARVKVWLVPQEHAGRFAGWAVNAEQLQQSAAAGEELPVEALNGVRILPKAIAAGSSDSGWVLELEEVHDTRETFPLHLHWLGAQPVRVARYLPTQGLNVVHRFTFDQSIVDAGPSLRLEIRSPLSLKQSEGVISAEFTVDDVFVNR